MKTLKYIINVVLVTMTMVFQLNAQIIQENKLKHETEATDIKAKVIAVKQEKKNETHALDGYWEHNVSNHCQKTIASYRFRSDTLMVYENLGCQGGTFSLYKYKVIKDTIVAKELETFKNMEGHIIYHYKDRMVECKIPICWFDKINSCFERRGLIGEYYKDKLEFKGISTYKWTGPKLRE